MAHKKEVVKVRYSGCAMPDTYSEYKAICKTLDVKPSIQLEKLIEAFNKKNKKK